MSTAVLPNQQAAIAGGCLDWYIGADYGSSPKLRIEPPAAEFQIVDAYFLYLQSLPPSALDFDATKANARFMVETLLGPAWRRKEPILLAYSGEALVGATFTTLMPCELTSARPFAYGHGTWVREDMREQGIAAALLEEVRRRLRVDGIVRQLGQAHLDNERSHTAFSHMGFHPCGTVLEAIL